MSWFPFCFKNFLSILHVTLLCGLVLAGCSGSNDYGTAPIPTAQIEEQIEAQALPQVEEPYTTGAGDKILVTVFNEEELSSIYTINNTGFLSFPLIGQFKVEGLTLGELETLLQNKLKEGYLKNPSVSAEIAEFRPFYILGEVRSPGSYSYVTGMNVLKAAAIAGGYTYRADKNSIEILRKKNSTSKILRDMTGSASVQPGDIILIKERFF